MKFEVEVECTPAEARAFLGLPDLTPLHDAWIARMKSLSLDAAGSEEWQKLMQAWTSGIPGFTQNMDNWQKMFWAAASAQDGGQTKDKD